MIGCDNDNNIIAFISPNAAVPSLPISAQRVARYLEQLLMLLQYQHH